MKSPTSQSKLRREKNDRLMSVHTSIDYGDIWWKKISAEARSGKRIAGLLKKKMMMMTKIVKSCMSRFSRGKLEAGKNELGLCTARYESKSCC